MNDELYKGISNTLMQLKEWGIIKGYTSHDIKDIWYEANDLIADSKYEIMNEQIELHFDLQKGTIERL